MARKWRDIVAILAALLSIPSVFLLAFWVLWRTVQSEYASGDRISTGGDTVTIPAAGVTAAWVVALAI
jgi:hypothetical protein